MKHKLNEQVRKKLMEAKSEAEIQAIMENSIEAFRSMPEAEKKAAISDLVNEISDGRAREDDVAHVLDRADTLFKNMVDELNTNNIITRPLIARMVIGTLLAMAQDKAPAFTEKAKQAEGIILDSMGYREIVFDEMVNVLAGCNRLRELMNEPDRRLEDFTPEWIKEAKELL